MNISRITGSDTDLVTELFNKYRIFYKQPSDLKLCKSFIEARVKNNESVIFVATEIENKEVVPIGFVQLYPKFSSGRAIKIWVLNDLFVEEGYRNKSVGKKLIAIALSYAQEDQVKQVELSTAVDNYTAQKLYEKMGFQKQKPDTNFLSYQFNLAEE